MVFLWLFLLGFLVEQTYACSQMRDSNNHPQSLFCQANYAAKVRVKSEAMVGDNEWAMKRKYTVTVLNVFKDVSGQLKRNKKAFFTSSASGGMCGASLAVGKVYFVSGPYYNGEYSFNSFNWISQWEYMSNPQRNYLKNGKYEANCKCQIAKCTDGKCNEDDMRADCQWAPGELSDCWAKNGACVKSKGPGKCEWSREADVCGKMNIVPAFMTMPVPKTSTPQPPKTHPVTMP